MQIWRNTYNVELNWDVFVLHHSRRCFSHIWDSTSMCRLTEEVDGPMIGFLCQRHFVWFLLCQSRHRHGTFLFPLILKKPDLSIEQWDSSNDWIVIEEIHVNAALAWSRIPTSNPPLRNWYHVCLLLGRSIFALRCPRAISWRTSDGKEVKRRIRASGPLYDRLSVCTLKNPSCP